MSLIKYPTENYNSWLSEDDADSYFETRLNSEAWNSANHEAALITSFRSIQILDLDIVLDDDNLISDAYYSASEIAEILTALQQAQAEQALHEIVIDVDNPGLAAFNLGGLLSVKMDGKTDSTPRFSERAMESLRPYLKARTVSRTR